MVDRVGIVMFKDTVSDNEALYRRVPYDRGFVKKEADGTFRISSQAFYEGGHRISVDRADLRENNPHKTLASYPGPAGVISIKAGDVRAIDGLEYNNKAQDSIQTFKVDVEPAPIFNDPVEEDNPSHAEICSKPECPRKVFQRLIERLALLAKDKWVTEPPSIMNIPLT